MTKREELTHRMLTFHADEGYSGGYCTLGLDDALIAEAVAEANAEHPDFPTDPVPLMCYLASQAVTSREEYENAERFMQCYFFACMDINFGETDNEVAAKLHADDC